MALMGLKWYFKSIMCILLICDAICDKKCDFVILPISQSALPNVNLAQFYAQIANECEKVISV